MATQGEQNIYWPSDCLGSQSKDHALNFMVMINETTIHVFNFYIYCILHSLGDNIPLP